MVVVQASLASGCVDVCLIPEVQFDLDGEQGLLAYLRQVLLRKGYAVVCVAEGAGQVSSLQLEPYWPCHVADLMKSAVQVANTCSCPANVPTHGLELFCEVVDHVLRNIEYLAFVH
jgi:hypothetical protein